MTDTPTLSAPNIGPTARRLFALIRIVMDEDRTDDQRARAIDRFIDIAGADAIHEFARAPNRPHLLNPEGDVTVTKTLFTDGEMAAAESQLRAGRRPLTGEERAAAVASLTRVLGPQQARIMVANIEAEVSAAAAKLKAESDRRREEGERAERHRERCRSFALRCAQEVAAGLKTHLHEVIREQPSEPWRAVLYGIDAHRQDLPIVFGPGDRLPEQGECNQAGARYPNSLIVAPGAVGGTVELPTCTVVASVRCVDNWFGDLMFAPLGASEPPILLALQRAGSKLFGGVRQPAPDVTADLRAWRSCHDSRGNYSSRVEHGGYAELTSVLRLSGLAENPNFEDSRPRPAPSAAPPSQVTRWSGRDAKGVTAGTELS